MLNIAICSGGTGGHMFPACALFELLKLRGHSVSMITDTRGERFCNAINEGDKVVVKTVRFNIRNIFSIIFDLIGISRKFLSIWKNNRPDIIVGFGSLFTIVPIMIGKLFGSKIIVYEQNSILGRANKFLSYFANFKVSTFTIDEKWQQLPSPVRKEFVKAKNSEYKCDDRIKIVVIGGSQGAVSFSFIIPNALSLISSELRKDIDIVQQVSSAKIDDLRKAYDKIDINARLLDFVRNVAEEMSSAQLIISRSGASTLAELSTLGRPAILIPYPLASDNHQYHNAVCYKNRKAAWIVEENENIERELSSIIINLLNNRQLLKDAASNMINGLGDKSTEIFADFIEKSAAEQR